MSDAAIENIKEMMNRIAGLTGKRPNYLELDAKTVSVLYYCPKCMGTGFLIKSHKAVVKKCRTCKADGRRRPLAMFKSLESVGVQLPE